MAFRSLFKIKTGIEKEIDDFLNQVSESGLLFIRGVETYFKGSSETFERLLQEIVDTEHHADNLRRSIEDHLYRRTLIPESRGDVLRTIETMDSLLGKFKGAMWRLQIEQPEMPVQLIDEFLNLADAVVKSVEAVTLSVRAYFRDINNVSENIHKVSFWEKEADKIATELQMKIFRDKELSRSKQLQLRDIIRHIEEISNQAEDVADSLAIYVIKRSL